MKMLRVLSAAITLLSCIQVFAREEFVVTPIVFTARGCVASRNSPMENEDDGLPAVIVHGNVIKLPRGLREGKSGADGERNFFFPTVESSGMAVFYAVRCIELDAAQYVSWPLVRISKIGSLARDEFDADALLDSTSSVYKRLCNKCEDVWYNAEVIKNGGILFGGFGCENVDGKKIYTVVWRCEFKVPECVAVLTVQKSTTNLKDLPGYREWLKTVMTEWAEAVLDDYPPSKNNPKDERAKDEPQLPNLVDIPDSDADGIDPNNLTKLLLGLAFGVVYLYRRNKKKKESL